MIRAIIVDDEEQSRQALLKTIELFCPQVEIIGEANNIGVAEEKINLLQPELVFLDIHLNRNSGFDLLLKFPKPDFRIIFVTGFNNYAVQAFKVCALDYLLKPVDSDELIEAVEKATEQIELEKIKLKYLYHNLKTQNEKDKIMIISSMEKDEYVNIPKVIALEAQGNYTYITRERENKICSTKNLKHFEQALENNDVFFRVHHKYIINTKYIKSFDKQNSLVTLKNGQRVPVSQRKRTLFIGFMRKNLAS